MIEELIHTTDGEIKSKDPLAPFKKVGTRFKIIDTNPYIHIRKNMLDLELEVTQYVLDRVKDGVYHAIARGMPVVWGHNVKVARADGGNYYLYPNMVEIIHEAS